MQWEYFVMKKRNVMKTKCKMLTEKNFFIHCWCASDNVGNPLLFVIKILVGIITAVIGSPNHRSRKISSTKSPVNSNAITLFVSNYFYIYIIEQDFIYYQLKDLICGQLKSEVYSTIPMFVLYLPIFPFIIISNSIIWNCNDLRI